MLIALAQINPIIGDLNYNTAKIIDYINKAKNNKADLVVFPEMSTIGYPARDLLERVELIQSNVDSLKDIAKYTFDIGAIVGYVDFNPFEGEKPLYNSASLIYKDKIIATQNKSLLPEYDVFDERRYFEPAHCVHNIDFLDKKLGITICEDLWIYSPQVSRIYKYDPNKVLTRLGADLLINLSASPYNYEKPNQRIQAIKNAALKNNKTFLYVNQIGGNDELIFDGGSIIVNSKGDIVAKAKNFEEDLIYYDTIKDTGDVNNTYDDEIECIYQALLLGIRDYVCKCNFKKVILGLSGGIDSALTASLAVKALGSENVIGILMPGPYSSQGSIDDSVRLAKNLGIEYHIIPINEMFNKALGTIQPDISSPLMDSAEENLQARLRAIIIMTLSNRYGYLALTTGNKSESAVGYATLYGDMCGGLAVISDLYKTQVYQIANFINKTENNPIPLECITKPPSAELKPNQFDQDSLPDYALLDTILKDYIELGLSFYQLIEKYDQNIVKFVLKKVDSSEFKRRQAAPGLKISTKAFGTGRRLPIAQRYKWK